MKCKHCNIFESDNKGTFLNHCAYCEKNPNQKSAAKILKRARQNIKHHSNQWIKSKETGIPYIVSDETKLKVSKSSTGRKHSIKTKKLISKKRKKYLKENSCKHPWKRNNKFKSIPCEYIKSILRDNNIKFVEEFTPLTNHAYSIDIAFPEKKIGIEINGNQHYNSDKTLKTYYQKRHDLIEHAGWKLYEFHYANCYKLDFLNKILELL